MDPDLWRRLETIFFAALDVQPGERRAFLDVACAGDAALRAEVDAILAGHERAGGGGLSLAPGTGGGGGAGGGATGETLRGKRLGPYRLEERVGRGGMGEVYRAERADDQYRQEVAVKLLRATLSPDEMARRFRVERQVLARLQHPNVATLLDGGVTEDGTPYLVMQYVRGSPITDHADTSRLALAERLRLFVTVCRTVHFAHSNLVVHRDLKPSNILVTPEGEVRLLDFGIAKLLDPEGMGVTAPLTEEHLMMTPEHAAPEQILGDPVTTATDVYALGVLLYELLTGTRPFRATLGPAWHRAVCEQDPPRPSVALTTLASGPTVRDAATVARARATRVPVLRQQLRGDLDHIVLMALRKEPERRYASAEQFAEDVERFLEGRPVLARRDTVGYRTRKFLRRNRLAVAAAAIVMLTLLGATLLSLGQSRARALALAEATVERDKAASLADFLLSVFDASAPATARGRTITARELLDRAALRIDQELATQPLARADLKLAIGRAYGALGLPDTALTLFQDALALRQTHGGGEEAELAEALDQVGRGLAATGRTEDALPYMREALALRERVLGYRDTLVAATLTSMARMEIDNGRYAGAETFLDRAIDIHRGAPGGGGREMANALRFYWLTLNWQDENARGLPYVREALQVAERALPDGDPFRYHVAQDYALALQGAGELDSATALFRRVLDGYVRVEGPDHPDVAYAYHNLGRVLGAQGRSDEALDAYRRGLQVREAALGPDHPTVTYILHSYSIALALSGEVDSAAVVEDRAIRLSEASFGPTHLTTLDAMELQAQLRALQGRHDEAITLLETLVDRGWANRRALDGEPFAETRKRAEFQALVERVGPGR